MNVKRCNRLLICLTGIGFKLFRIDEFGQIRLVFGGQIIRFPSHKKNQHLALMTSTALKSKHAINNPSHQLPGASFTKMENVGVYDDQKTVI